MHPTYKDFDSETKVNEYGAKIGDFEDGNFTWKKDALMF